jgi:hypothetical protein
MRPATRADLGMWTHAVKSIDVDAMAREIVPIPQKASGVGYSRNEMDMELRLLRRPTPGVC